MKSAYKRYLICKNELNGLWWIERDGAFICHAIDRTDAMRIIDEELT